MSAKRSSREPILLPKGTTIRIHPSEKDRLGEAKYNEFNYFFFELALGEYLQGQGVSFEDTEEARAQRIPLIERYIAEHPEAQEALAPYRKKEA